MQAIPMRKSVSPAPTNAPTARRQPRPRSTGWIPVALIAILAGIVGGAWGLRHDRPVPSLAARTAAVPGAPSVVGPSFAGPLKLQGRLQTQTMVRVGSLSPGQLTAVTVDVGDRVVRGQVLARLDDLEQKRATADARAATEAAQLQRARAEKHVLEELGKLDDEGSSAGDLGPDDLLGGSAGEAQLDLMSSYVQIDRANSRRALALGILARRSIRAPMAGVVLARSVDPGETISSSPPGPPLFVIGSDPARLRVDVELDEAEAARVRPGSVTFSVPAYPLRSFKADLRQLLPATALPVSASRYRAILDVDNTDGALLPGMTATVSLPVGTAEGAPSVRVSALLKP
jgi:HlyD family secretion protein